MPLETKHYKLEAFLWGDTYTSFTDKKRFTIIDNQMELISNMIGNGVIDGWTVIDNGDETASVSSGIGIIDKRVVQSFGQFIFSLNGNTIHYVYIKSKQGEVGGISGNSNISEIVGVDATPPSSPSGITKEDSIESYLSGLASYSDDLVNYLRQLLKRKREEELTEIISYKEVAFSWDANTEADFSHYKVSRIDGSNITVLGNTTETIYADTGLIQNHSYDYSVVAVDMSGNESSASNITISTDIDTRIPSPPMNVKVFPSDSVLEVIWDHSPTGEVNRYQVDIQPLDLSYNNNGSITSITVDSSEEIGLDSTYAVFRNLENNINYDVTVYAIPVGGDTYKSNGVTVRTFLQSFVGAGEVNSIRVEFSVSSFSNVGIETNVGWSYSTDDSSHPNAENFVITVIENGSRFSEPMVVSSASSLIQSGCPGGDNSDGACFSFEIKYLPFNIDGDIEYESIKEFTSYIFVVQTEDSDRNLSNGVLLRVQRSPVSAVLPEITNFSISRKSDNSIFISWENPPQSYFSHNLISISIVDLASNDVDGEFYAKELRIDQSETFIIPSEKFNIDYRYDVSITPYDVFETAGTEYQEYVQFTNEEEEVRPSEPSGLQIRPGDTVVHLTWSGDKKQEEEIDFYKVYRSDFSYYISATGFVHIATVPSTHDYFTDYTVVNDNIYTYFITAVDVYGNESLNPAQDAYMPTILVSANPTAGLSLTPPGTLSCVAGINPMDAELSWEPTSGSFDGYEILRSDENNYSFRVIDNVPVSQLSYTDTDAILKNVASYFYLVRKYKNEVTLSVTSSSVAPTASVLVGVVTTTNGTDNVDIDVSSVVNILNFEDPLIDKTNEAISLHHHTNDDGVDKRIELRSNIHVDDWTTDDYAVYSTEQDVSGGSNYFLTIEGELNESYFVVNNVLDVSKFAQAQSGESPVLYDIDYDSGKITFNSALYSSGGEFSAPYLTEPELSLEVLGVSEVDGYLPPENVSDFSATQFLSGAIDSRQMPGVNHQGRKSERLLPIRLPLKTLDNFVYSLAATYENSDRNQMGTSVTFYDVIKDTGSILLSATSNGIWLSENYGNDWKQVATFPSAVHRLYKSDSGEYYALTNYGVYKNIGTSFHSWEAMSGLDYVKSIRDIDEDSNGNLYISTDIGVFKLNSESVPYIEDTWEKMSIFGARSSEAYAILYDIDYSDSSSTGRILVSNDLGLLQSTDEGRSWVYITELESNVIIRWFFKEGNYIFALSDISVYRQEISQGVFDKISDLGVSQSRRMVVFDDKIYITTDDGARSSSSSNIYIDSNIEFLPEWSGVNINKSAVVVTSLNNIDNDLFVGTDRKLFILNDDNKFWVQFEEKNTVIPTFYIDSVVQKIGYYYNNGGAEQNISFDDIINNESEVSVANSYDMYFTEYGGWAHNKFDAKFVVYLNNNIFGESRDEIELDPAPFSNMVLPEYDDNNANKVTADVYKTYIDSDVEQLTSVTPPVGEDMVDLVIKTYLDIELFLSQIYKEARVVVDDDGNTSNFVLPKIETDIITKRLSTSNTGTVIYIEEPVYKTINDERSTSYSTSVNAVNGMFVFDLPFDKYDNLTIDINSVTVKNVGAYGHRDIEDAFEQVYSGPPSYLSQVQQVNIVKMGIFSEKNWPGQQSLYSTPWQMRTFVPADDTWYDTLNSTINYEVRDENTGLSLSLFYPSCAIFSTNSESVLVGGIGGVLFIDPNTLNMNVVDIGDVSTQLVRSILDVGDKTYILTDKHIFVSSDSGVTWSEYNRSGLPNNLYSFGTIKNNLIVGGEDGIYIKLSDSDAIQWEKVKDSTSPVSIIYSSNILFAVVDGFIFVTSNGFTYTDTEIGEDLDITNITRYGFTNTYVSTNQGLYSDNGTFNSIEPKLEEVDLSALLADESITVNDIVTNNSDSIAIGVSSGSYGIIYGDIFRIKDFTSLESIHKILFVNDDVWLFGQDVFKVPYLDYPIKLSTGAPV